MHATATTLLVVLALGGPPSEADRASTPTLRGAPTIAPARHQPEAQAREPRQTPTALRNKQAVTQGSERRAVVDHCLVSLIDDVNVSAQEAGVLLTVPVSDGQSVRIGELLAQTDDRRAQVARETAEIELRAAQEKADDDIEVRYAEAAHDVARQEFENALEINRNAPKTVPKSEVRRRELAMKRARLQIDRSKLDLRVAKMSAEVHLANVKAAEQAVARRKILSPVNGQVVSVLIRPGEWVDPGDAVVRLVRLDRLRVEGFLDASRFDPAVVDQRPVSVSVESDAGRTEQFVGQVVYVSPLIQSGDKYRVRAEVENRTEQRHWRLKPGKTARMTIQLASPPATTARSADRGPLVGLPPFSPGDQATIRSPLIQPRSVGNTTR